MKNEIVPFVDLHAQYLTIKEEIDAAIAAVIANSAFIRGSFVEKFEEEFSAAIGVDHCVSCANGTDALFIAMRSLEVKPGDEVIVPAHSWISTSETVTQAGGQVVFCDTDAVTHNIDVTQLESKITNRTVGIIPVHLFGQPANMVRVMEIAERHKLWVIEDCAQAHLAKYNGQNVGTFGDVSTFSFYPGKNLGAMGDAGAILTDDKLLSSKMTMFARHGGLRKGDHQIEGINSRLDGLQAAILSVKLNYLRSWTEARQRAASHYTDLLSKVSSVVPPASEPNSEHVWHLYVIQHGKRDDLARTLRERGIQTVINYPVALPFLPAYKRLAHVSEDFPNAYHHQDRILSLPIYPELSHETIQRVVDEIGKFEANSQ